MADDDAAPPLSVADRIRAAAGRSSAPAAAAPGAAAHRAVDLAATPSAAERLAALRRTADDRLAELATGTDPATGTELRTEAHAMVEEGQAALVEAAQELGVGASDLIRDLPAVPDDPALPSGSSTSPSPTPDHAAAPLATLEPAAPPAARPGPPPPPPGWQAPTTPTPSSTWGPSTVPAPSPYASAEVTASPYARTPTTTTTTVSAGGQGALAIAIFSVILAFIPGIGILGLAGGITAIRMAAKAQRRVREGVEASAGPAGIAMAVAGVAILLWLVVTISMFSG